jgi:hypothetical protein
MSSTPAPAPAVTTSTLEVSTAPIVRSVGLGEGPDGWFVVYQVTQGDKVISTKQVNPPDKSKRLAMGRLNFAVATEIINGKE